MYNDKSQQNRKREAVYLIMDQSAVNLHIFASENCELFTISSQPVSGFRKTSMKMFASK